MSDKHVYRDSNCQCKECGHNRQLRELKELRRNVFETEARKTFGPNWKNILAGMGDQ